MDMFSRCDIIVSFQDDSCIEICIFFQIPIPKHIPLRESVIAAPLSL